MRSYKSVMLFRWFLHLKRSTYGYRRLSSLSSNPLLLILIIYDDHIVVEGKASSRTEILNRPSYDIQISSSCKARKLPSGCLIQDIDGYSKVTWVEHWEVEDKAPIHSLYRDLVHSSFAFGAERWLSTLQRMCRRFIWFVVTGNSSLDLGGVIPSPEGKRGMMKLSQRMVNNFCSSIYLFTGQHWTTLSTLNEFEVHATLHKSMDPGQPDGVVLSAAATIRLPLHPQDEFDFFRDERTGAQDWKIMRSYKSVILFRRFLHLKRSTYGCRRLSSLSSNPLLTILII